MSLPTLLQLVQGKSRDFIRQTPNDDGTFGGIYSGTESIDFTLWPGDSEVPTLTQSGLPNVWVDAPTTTWLISFADSQTAILTPGVYRLVVSAPTTVSRTGVLFDGLLEVVAGSGSTIPLPTPLVSDTYAAKLLAGAGLRNDQWEMLPDLLAAASLAVRRECGDRDFTRATYSEEYSVAFDGYIRLNQIPVNQVLRVQSSPRTAITISNTSTAVQVARVYFTLTGDLAIGQAVTGLTLSWVSSGVTTTQPIAFTAGQMISDLATAINAVGSGWSATADSFFGPWPVTELIAAAVSWGCNNGALAELQVYADDLSGCRFHPDGGQRTGLYWVGSKSLGVGPRWGPDWRDLNFQDGSGTVKVTYDAGFTTVPAPIQLACVEAVQAAFSRLDSDAALKSETAADYAYVFRDSVGLFSDATRQALAKWKIHNA